MQKEKSQIKNLKIFFQTNNNIIFGIFGMTHWLPNYFYFMKTVRKYC